MKITSIYNDVQVSKQISRPAIRVNNVSKSKKQIKALKKEVKDTVSEISENVPNNVSKILTK